MIILSLRPSIWFNNRANRWCYRDESMTYNEFQQLMILKQLTTATATRKTARDGTIDAGWWRWWWRCYGFHLRMNRHKWRISCTSIRTDPTTDYGIKESWSKIWKLASPRYNDDKWLRSLLKKENIYNVTPSRTIPLWTKLLQKTTTMTTGEKNVICK